VEQIPLHKNAERLLAFLCRNPYRPPPLTARGADAVIVDLEVGHEAQRGLGEAIRMPVADDPLWKEWLTAEKALGEARDQLRTVEHLDLGHRKFQEAWQAYRLALDVFNAITNKL
jgi:hypothetical protein